MFLAMQLQEIGCKKRPLLEVKWPCTFGLEPGRDCSRLVRGRRCREINDGQLNGRRPIDQLIFALGIKGGAQCFMAANHLLDGLLQRRHMQRTRQAQRNKLIVGCRRCVAQLRQDPQLLLRGTQGCGLLGWQVAIYPMLDRCHRDRRCWPVL